MNMQKDILKTVFRAYEDTRINIRNLKNRLMRDESYYINIYNNLCEHSQSEWIKENGSLKGYDCSVSDSNVETVDEVVGYYLSIYDERALEQWLDNLSIHSNNTKVFDRDVTYILKSFQNS